MSSRSKNPRIPVIYRCATFRSIHSEIAAPTALHSRHRSPHPRYISPDAARDSLPAVRADHLPERRGAPVRAPAGEAGGAAGARRAVPGATGRLVRTPLPRRPSASRARSQTFEVDHRRATSRPASARPALPHPRLRRHRLHHPDLVQGRRPASGASSIPVGRQRVVSGKVERYGARTADRAPGLSARPPSAPTRSRRRGGLSGHRRPAARAPCAGWRWRRWSGRRSCRNGRTRPGSRAQGWPSWREALEALHAPADRGRPVARQRRARRRLAYDELLRPPAGPGPAQGRPPAPSRPASSPPAPWPTRVEAALPFRLTGAQIRSLAEIRGDLAVGRAHDPAAAGRCRRRQDRGGHAGHGRRRRRRPAVGADGAHRDPGAPALRDPRRAARRPGRRRRCCSPAATRARRGPRSWPRWPTGAAAVAVGTHALFQDDVAFHALALTVIDEQHRFGVSERRRLQAKGEAVHLLAMSATPIPRTLELTVYRRPRRLAPRREAARPHARRHPRRARCRALGEVVARLRAGGRAPAPRPSGSARWSPSPRSVDLAAAEARAAALRQASRRQASA